MIDLLVLLASTLITLWVLYHLTLLLIPKTRRTGNPETPTRHSGSRSNLKISIIVPYKSRYGFLLRFIEELRDIEGRELLECVFVGAKPDIPIKTRKLPDGISVKFVEDPYMAGKPLALKQGFRYCSGDIIGVVDVDTILPKDFVQRILDRFSDGVEALQCRTLAVNSEQSIISCISSIEEYIFHKLAENRDRLSLFTPLTGNCYFISKHILAETGLWSNVLTEDIDLSIRLLRQGVTVKYEPNIVCYQEAPSTLKALVKQRFRWYKGYTETLLRHFRHIPLKLKGLDLLLILSGPFITALSLVNFILTLLILGNSVIPQFVTTLYLTSFITATVYLHSFKKGRIPLHKWILSIFPYWVVQGILSISSIVSTLLRVEYKWVETDKSGYLDSHAEAKAR